MDLTRWSILGLVAVLIGVAVYIGLNMIRVDTVGTITVMVNDSDGNPAPGVIVVLKRGNEIVVKSTTGEDGIVVFLNVPLNVEYTVEAKSEDGFALDKIFPRNDGDSFVLTLKRGGEGGGSDRPNL